jgi:predicted RNA-binding protein with PIN domain
MYIIDGYNLLKLIQKSSDEHELLSRIDLCRLIGSFLSFKKQNGTIIFDGPNPDENTNYSSGVEVIFAGPGKDADSLIEKKIACDTAPRRLLVVSNDRRIRNAANAGGSTSIKSEKFWQHLLSSLKRKKQIYEPPEKRKGLDQSQTKQWMEYFGLE